MQHHLHHHSFLGRKDGGARHSEGISQALRGFTIWGGAEMSPAASVSAGAFPTDIHCPPKTKHLVI